MQTYAKFSTSFFQFTSQNSFSTHNEQFHFSDVIRQNEKKRRLPNSAEKSDKTESKILCFCNVSMVLPLHNSQKLHTCIPYFSKCQLPMIIKKQRMRLTSKNWLSMFSYLLMIWSIVFIVKMTILMFRSFLSVDNTYQEAIFFSATTNNNAYSLLWHIHIIYKEYIFDKNLWENGSMSIWLTNVDAMIRDTMECKRVIQPSKIKQISF